MINAMDRLRSLKVSDVMTKVVFQVESSQRMSEVAGQFTKHGLSSAPVVDEQGRCVGMLSSVDFLKRDCVSFMTDEHSWTTDSHRLQNQNETESLQIAPVAEDMVASYMTAAVQTIAEDLPLLKAAFVMCAEHIHRLPVLGDDDRVVGLISTMDIVAALMNSINEMDAALLKQLKE